MPQATRTCEAVGASLRSLSESASVSNTMLGGKYDIKKKIELYKGSVSTVYKCLLAGGSAVVVKTYHKNKMADKHFHKLEREVAAMRALCREVGKKGVVQLLDTYEDSHGIYLVMECCEGGDLFKRLMLHGGKLPEHWVCVEVIAPLLRVLERMHALHIMHRDIKPENIFIAADGEVKLGDFGLAIDWTKELPFSRSGTLDYMAPEVLVNPATHAQESPAVSLPQLLSKNIRPYSAAVDVWAVGCLAYELVCGRPPFEVEDEKQTASLIIYSNNIHFEHSATPSWADFVTQALIKDPRQRPDATSLLGHSWIRSHLERAASHLVAATVSHRQAAPAAAAATAAAAPVGDHAVRVGAGGPSEQLGDSSRGAGGKKHTNSNSGMQSPVGMAAGSKAGGPSSNAISLGGSSACGSAASFADSVSIASGVSAGGSSAGAASSFSQRSSSTTTTTTTANGFRNAAALLATRASQQGCMTPPPASANPASAGASPGSASNGMSYGTAPASAPPPQRAPASPSSAPYRAPNLSSSGALRSLLDAFKSASINSASGDRGDRAGADVSAGGDGVRSSGSVERIRPPSASGTRPPSAGALPNKGTSASSLLRASFQFQLPSERDGGGGGSGGNSSASNLLRKSFHVQLPGPGPEREVSLGGASTAAVVGCRSASNPREGAPPDERTRCVPPTGSDNMPQDPHASLSHGVPLSPLQRTPQAAGATSGAGMSGGGGFTSPSRMARTNVTSTAPGFASPAGGASAGGHLSNFLRHVGSFGAAGGPALDAPLPSNPTKAASPGSHFGKPPRPQSESPGKVFAMAAAAVAAQCNPNSPLRRSIQPSPPRAPQPSMSPPGPQHSASPPRLQPCLSGPRGDLSPSCTAPPMPLTLHDLTRSWGAVVSISVGKYATVAQPGAAYSGRGCDTGSGFTSPQRLQVGAGKGLDAYGLPPPTPVASGLPPAEYCSPRPSGVLERVKYHLRGGGSAPSAVISGSGGGNKGGVPAPGGSGVRVGAYQGQHQQLLLPSQMQPSMPAQGSGMYVMGSSVDVM